MWASSPTALHRTDIVRISYVKYSTGANKTTRIVYRALGKPDSTAARRAFLAECIIGEWHAESKCLFRRVSAISFSSASFLPILFWQDRKEWAAGGIPRHSGAFEMYRRRPFSIWKNAISLDMASLRPCGQADNRR